MGHQVNFYATPRDMQELGRLLSQKISFAVGARYSSTPAPERWAGFPSEPNSTGPLSSFVSRPEDLGDVRTTHIESQSQWRIDETRSPIVECSLCFFDGKVLRRGRFYYVDWYYLEDQKIVKSVAFREWASTVLKVTRRFMRPLDDVARIAPDAERWLSSSNGTLE